MPGLTDVRCVVFLIVRSLQIRMCFTAGGISVHWQQFSLPAVPEVGSLLHSMGHSGRYGALWKGFLRHQGAWWFPSSAKGFVPTGFSAKQSSFRGAFGSPRAGQEFRFGDSALKDGKGEIPIWKHSSKKPEVGVTSLRVTARWHTRITLANQQQQLSLRNDPIRGHRQLLYTSLFL